MKKTKIVIHIFAVMAIALSLSCPAILVYAMEEGTEAVGSVMLPTIKEDIISVELPTVRDESPFDFFIDPQGLLYETDAVLQGGGTVEEGAYLLFHNHGGEYDFSKNSDMLRVVNQSNVPVIVTVTAGISDLGELELMESPNLEGSDVCSMYLAIVDDEGNERPVSEDGEVSVSIEMRKAPDNAYVYRIDEETGEYSYELTTSPEEIDFDSYSFGLVGYCNPNGNWQDIYVHPRVTVTWRVEPVFSEEEEIDRNDEAFIEERETPDTEDEEDLSEAADVEGLDDKEDIEDIKNIENTESVGDSESDSGDDAGLNDEESSISKDTENLLDDARDDGADTEAEDSNNSVGVTDDTFDLDAAGEINDSQVDEDVP